MATPSTRRDGTVFINTRQGIFSVIPKDDPNEIADSLVQQHGQAAALAEAMRRLYEAQSNERFYDLSIWREVRRILRDPS